MSFGFNLSELTGKVTNRIKHIMYKIKVKRVHLRHRRNNQDEYKRYDYIIKQFRASGGLKHDFQAYKLYSLSKLLEQEKPMSILELGTGTSTVIFVDYIRKEEGASLTSVDESQHWLNISKELADIKEDEKKIELIYAKRNINLQRQPKETKYDYKFKKYFDFVFIDGPSLAVDGITDKNISNTNIFDIVKHKFPNTIIVDIRKATVKEIIKRLGGYYNICISDIITKNFCNNYCYFSIFKLREN